MQQEQGKEEEEDQLDMPRGGMLVVAPKSLLRQWLNELSIKVAPAAALSVLAYQGSQRDRLLRDPEALAQYLALRL